MSKIGALQWTRIGVDCGWGGYCTAWNSGRISLATLTSCFGMQQGWLVLTRFRCVPNIQNMTENNFLFCFVLIIHNSNSLKSMEAASTIESLLIKDLVILRMCSSLTLFAYVLAMNMVEGSFARNISLGSFSIHGFPSPWQIITKRIIASGGAMGQPLPISVIERHPPWELAASYLVA